VHRLPPPVSFALGCALAACTPSEPDAPAGPRPVEPPPAAAPTDPTPDPAPPPAPDAKPDPKPVDPTPSEGPLPLTCPAVIGTDPRIIELGKIGTGEPADLRKLAKWTRVVDARGGYDHAVGMDDDSNVVWAHDTKSMVFALDSVAQDGTLLVHELLNPKQLEPQALHVDAIGDVTVGGTSFAPGAAGGGTIVSLDSELDERWRVKTPRLWAHDFAVTRRGETIVRGSTARQEITLGPHTLRNEWLGVGHSMDILSSIDGEGRFQWSRAFFPGVLQMAHLHDSLYLAGNFGHAQVDYGGGPTQGPGVLARLEDDSGEHIWSVGFPTGLRAVVPTGDEVLAVGFGQGFSMGGPVIEGTPAAWFDRDGCYRGSVDLGTGVSRFVATPDGSLLVYGMSLSGSSVRLGPREFAVGARQWFVARLAPSLEIQWAATIACDGLEAAASDGRTAFSCFRDLSRGRRLLRQYTLLVL